MAIVPMTSAVAGSVASSDEYNKLITNINDINTRLNQADGGSAGSRLSTLEARTLDTVTSPGGIGNQRLADRLGTGVGTGANVLTGSATSQLTEIRSRLTTVEAATSSGGPMVQLRQTVAQAFASATIQALTFDTEDLDTHNGHSTSTNPTRWTCPSGWAGWYECSGQVFWLFPGGTPTGSRVAYWYVNNAVASAGIGTPLPGDQGQSAAARSVLVYLAVGDYIELRGRQAQGVSMNTDISTGNQSTMTLRWIHT
jgi:hypothetical protein